MSIVRYATAPASYDVNSEADTDPTAAGPTGPGRKDAGLTSLGRTVESTVFTVAISIVLVAGPVAIVWWVIQAWSRSNVLSLDLVTAVISAASIGAWMRVMRPEAPIRRFALVPVAIQSGARELVGRSAFGFGRLSDWTSVEPDHGLSRIRRPQSLDALRLSGLVDAEGRERGMRRGPDRSRTVVAETITPPRPAPASRPRHETVEHVVTRGESFWSLAEQRLGDGRRWTEIRDLNIDREVAPGVVFSERDVPQVGHRILVPDTAAPSATPTSD